MEKQEGPSELRARPNLRSAPPGVHFFFQEEKELREYLERLVALQTIDLKIQEMEREKKQIPQFITSLEEGLKLEEEKFHEERAELERLQKERRQKEKDLEEEVDRVRKAEARIYEIKTNKEYQAVLKEIENAKNLNRRREEEILEILERLEEGQQRITREEKQLEGKRKEFQQAVGGLRQKESSFEGEMADEVRRREERERGIPADLLTKYRMLVEKRHGIAVARVIQGVCQACNMNLRPQLYIELQKQDSLILCPNCNRILFWENGTSRAEES
jgi:predicted  nucleic acid-binding Zn-ribbon protein